MACLTSNNNSHLNFPLGTINELQKIEQAIVAARKAGSNEAVVFDSDWTKKPVSESHTITSPALNDNFITATYNAPWSVAYVPNKPDVDKVKKLPAAPSTLSVGYSTKLFTVDDIQPDGSVKIVDHGYTNGQEVFYTRIASYALKAIADLEPSGRGNEPGSPVYSRLFTIKVEDKDHFRILNGVTNDVDLSALAPIFLTPDEVSIVNLDREQMIYDNRNPNHRHAFVRKELVHTQELNSILSSKDFHLFPLYSLVQTPVYHTIDFDVLTDDDRFKPRPFTHNSSVVKKAPPKVRVTFGPTAVSSNLNESPANTFSFLSNLGNMEFSIVDHVGQQYDIEIVNINFYNKQLAAPAGFPVPAVITESTAESRKFFITYKDKRESREYSGEGFYEKSNFPDSKYPTFKDKFEEFLNTLVFYELDPSTHRPVEVVIRDFATFRLFKDASSNNYSLLLLDAKNESSTFNYAMSEASGDPSITKSPSTCFIGPDSDATFIFDDIIRDSSLGNNKSQFTNSAWRLKLYMDIYFAAVYGIKTPFVFDLIDNRLIISSGQRFEVKSITSKTNPLNAMGIIDSVYNLMDSNSIKYCMMTGKFMYAQSDANSHVVPIGFDSTLPFYANNDTGFNGVYYVDASTSTDIGDIDYALEVPYPFYTSFSGLTYEIIDSQRVYISRERVYDRPHNVVGEVVASPTTADLDFQLVVRDEISVKTLTKIGNTETARVITKVVKSTTSNISSYSVLNTVVTREHKIPPQYNSEDIKLLRAFNKGDYYLESSQNILYQFNKDLMGISDSDVNGTNDLTFTKLAELLRTQVIKRISSNGGIHFKGFRTSFADYQIGDHAIFNDAIYYATQFNKADDFHNQHWAKGLITDSGVPTVLYKTKYIVDPQSATPTFEFSLVYDPVKDNRAHALTEAQRSAYGIVPTPIGSVVLNNDQNKLYRRKRASYHNINMPYNYVLATDLWPQNTINKKSADIEEKAVFNVGSVANPQYVILTEAGNLQPIPHLVSPNAIVAGVNYVKIGSRVCKVVHDPSSGVKIGDYVYLLGVRSYAQNLYDYSKGTEVLHENNPNETSLVDVIQWLEGKHRSNGFEGRPPVIDLGSISEADFLRGLSGNIVAMLKYIVMKKGNKFTVKQYDAPSATFRSLDFFKQLPGADAEGFIDQPLNATDGLRAQIPENTVFLDVEDRPVIVKKSAEFGIPLTDLNHWESINTFNGMTFFKTLPTVIKRNDVFLLSGKVMDVNLYNQIGYDDIKDLTLGLDPNFVPFTMLVRARKDFLSANINTAVSDYNVAFLTAHAQFGDGRGPIEFITQVNYRNDEVTASLDDDSNMTFTSKISQAPIITEGPVGGLKEFFGIENNGDDPTKAVLPIPVDIMSNTFYLKGHNFKNGDVVKFSSSNQLPKPLSKFPIGMYFITNATDDTFQIAKTLTDSQLMRPVDILESPAADLSVQKIDKAEQYRLAWKGVYNNRSLIGDMNKLIQYFKCQNIALSRIDDGDRFHWHIRWC